jgi:hypothetical protein
MKVPELLSLDASKGAVRVLLLCRTVSDDMNRELATLIPKHGKTLHRLAPRPQPQFTQAVSR